MLVNLPEEIKYVLLDKLLYILCCRNLGDEARLGKWDELVEDMVEYLKNHNISL